VRFCVSEQDEESDSSVDSLSDGELNKLIQDASKKMRSAGEGGPSYDALYGRMRSAGGLIIPSPRLSRGPHLRGGDDRGLIIPCNRRAHATECPPQSASPRRARLKKPLLPVEIRDVDNDDDGDYNDRVSESAGEVRGCGSAAKPPTTKTYFATRHSGFKHIFWTRRVQEWLVQIPGVRTERTAFLDDAKRMVARYQPLQPSCILSLNREARKRQGGHRGPRGGHRDALIPKDGASSTDRDKSNKWASAGLKKAAGARDGSPTKDSRLQFQSFSASLPPETSSEVQVARPQPGAVTHQGTCRMCLAHVQTHDIRDQSSP